jgi:type IV pilus assembly protein PilM
MPFLNNYAYPIGLDISDRSIKLVQLKKSGRHLKIQALGKARLPKEILENGEIKNRELLIKALRRLISHPGLGKVTTNEASVCLPEGKTFLKILEIEKETENLKEAIEKELQKHIPLPPEEIYYDWQEIGESGKARLILVGAAPKNIVEEQLSVLKEAGLLTVAVEAEPLSICRALLKEEGIDYKSNDRKNYAIIDIGADEAGLSVYSKNTILFSVSMPISGERITEEIANSLGMDREQAEKIKILHGLDEDETHPEVKKILSQMTIELTGKIKEAIAFFNHHFSGWGLIEEIIICGGGANIKNLDKTIQKETGIKAVKGDILTNLKGEKNNDKHFQETFGLSSEHLPGAKDKSGEQESKTLKFSQNAGLSYATAIGLALRGALMDE